MSLSYSSGLREPPQQAATGAPSPGTTPPQHPRRCPWPHRWLLAPPHWLGSRRPAGRLGSRDAGGSGRDEGSSAGLRQLVMSGSGALSDLATSRPVGRVLRTLSSSEQRAGIVVLLEDAVRRHARSELMSFPAALRWPSSSCRPTRRRRHDGNRRRCSTSVSLHHRLGAAGLAPVVELPLLTLLSCVCGAAGRREGKLEDNATTRLPVTKRRRSADRGGAGWSDCYDWWVRRRASGQRCQLL